MARIHRSLAAALLLPLIAHAQPLLVLDDPAGDDLGDGSPVYPRDGVIARGDLDLRQLRLVDEGGELRIEATFANPIRNPAEVGSGQGGNESLALFARRGFYAFNIDLYIDVDGQAGSGNSSGLPGRRIRFEPPFAWDKAIVLTPRPELMRRQLGEALADAASPAELSATLDRSVHFATDVRVRGRTVSYTVPRAFLAPAAVPGAALVAVVTAAKINIEADLGRFGGSDRGRQLERLALGAQQPQSGRPADGLGYRSETPPATAVVDLLDPGGAAQARQLAQGVLSPLQRGNRSAPTADGVGAPAVAAAPAAPSTAAATGSTPGSSWFDRALGALGSLFGAGAAAGATGAAAAPTAPPASLPSAPLFSAPAPAAAGASPPAPPLAPATPPAAAPAPSSAAAPAAAAVRPAARPPRDAAFYEEQEQRLRALQRLRERNLITEEEFQRKRKEIIEAL